MYRIVRGLQRIRHHTEEFLIYEQPLLQTGRRQAFSCLTRLWETTLQPEARWVSPPLYRAEVVTLVQKGLVRFTDPAGEPSPLSATTAHRFTAQAGNEVSFTNDSDRDCARYLQIWFKLNRKTADSGFDSQIVQMEARDQTLFSVASGPERSEALQLSEDAAVYLSKLRPSENLIFETLLSRRVFLLVIEGLVRADEHRLQDFDSAMIWKETSITLSAQRKCALLLIDLE